MNADDRITVEKWLRDWFSVAPEVGVARRADDVADAAPDNHAGVPPELWADDVDSEGWVAWRPIESHVTESQLQRLEGDFGITFPALFRALILTSAVVAIDTGTVILPNMPPDAPLDELRSLMTQGSHLIARGYVPCGGLSRVSGVMCFDRCQQVDGDAPVVGFAVSDLALAGTSATRADLERTQMRLFTSFRSLMETELRTRRRLAAGG